MHLTTLILLFKRVESVAILVNLKREEGFHLTFINFLMTSFNERHLSSIQLLLAPDFKTQWVNDISV